MASRRLPGKPLAEIGAKPMVQWVYERTVASKVFDIVCVATEDLEVERAVKAFGGRVEMTRSDHTTGTDRVAEVAARLGDADVVANVQGDQPFVDEEMLETLVRPFGEDRTWDMSTIACPLDARLDARDPNVVKVVADVSGRALYFSRSAIPFSPQADPEPRRLHHVGLYAFARHSLERFADLDPGPLETAEGLEQLRAVEHGFEIYVGIVPHVPIEVNTAEDLDRARMLAR